MKKSSLNFSMLLCAALAAVPAFADDYPPRKPGLWETTVQSDATTKSPPNVSQQCIDAASDKAMREMGMGMSQGLCSRQEMRRDGARLVIDSVCKIGTTSATTHGVISGDFQSAYRMEMTSTYAPPMMGRAGGSSVIEARWVGPCKAGQKPGDMVMANGMTMNLLDMMKRAPAQKPR